MIDHEQLAAALQRLDPREREVLYLSLCRRVPDASLADVLDCETPDVARRRAAAIDRLGDDLGVQRGEDLGHMLKALLEPETWAALEAAEAESEPEEEPPVEESSDEEAPTVDETDGLQPAEASAAQETAVAAPPGNGAGASKPVLEMLARPDEPERRPDATRAVAWIVAGTFTAAALIAAAGFAGATWFGGEESSDRGQSASEERHFTSRGFGPLAAPFPSAPEAACYTTAYVRRATILYNRPGGRGKLRIPARTEWRSPRVLSVVKQRGDWLGVTASELKNGQVAWLRRDRARVNCVRWSLEVDLSKRALFVREDGRTVRRITIAIGARAHPTPTGRFAVTDRLDVVDRASPYGCCVLALSGHQVKLPPDWPGGDRLAIHATTDTSSIGKAVSLGCMRAASSHARWLIERVPLGAPVFIRS